MKFPDKQGEQHRGMMAIWGWDPGIPVSLVAIIMSSNSNPPTAETNIIPQEQPPPKWSAANIAISFNNKIFGQRQQARVSVPIS